MCPVGTTGRAANRSHRSSQDTPKHSPWKAYPFLRSRWCFAESDFQLLLTSNRYGSICRVISYLRTVGLLVLRLCESCPEGKLRLDAPLRMCYRCEERATACSWHASSGYMECKRRATQPRAAIHQCRPSLFPPHQLPHNTSIFSWKQELQSQVQCLFVQLNSNIHRNLTRTYPSFSRL